MNLPNKLTVVRICLVPVFVFFMLADFVSYRYIFALVVFAVASYTDHLDGKIARSRNLVTNFGKLMDPLADKILVMSALICFVKLNLASAVCVIIIMFREFAVTSIRLISVEQGKVIPANNWGKAKTVSQMVAVIAVLTFQSVIQPGFFQAAAINGNAVLLNVAGEVLIYIATLLTFVSGVIYARDSSHIFKDF